MNTALTEFNGFKKVAKGTEHLPVTEGQIQRVYSMT